MSYDSGHKNPECMHDDFGDIIAYYKLNMTQNLNNLKNKNIFQKFAKCFNYHRIRTILTCLIWYRMGIQNVFTCLQNGLSIIMSFYYWPSWPWWLQAKTPRIRQNIHPLPWSCDLDCPVPSYSKPTCSPQKSVKLCAICSCKLYFQPDLFPFPIQFPDRKAERAISGSWWN